MAPAAAVQTRRSDRVPAPESAAAGRLVWGESKVSRIPPSEISGIVRTLALQTVSTTPRVPNDHDTVISPTHPLTMLSRLGLGLALGQRATRVVFTSRPAAPRQLAHARRLLSSTPVYREQQDLKIPHLSPPWQVEDMSRLEKEKYNEYGPDYMTHVTEEEREHFERRAVQRAKAATALEEQLGDNWCVVFCLLPPPLFPPPQRRGGGD